MENSQSLMRISTHPNVYSSTLCRAQSPGFEMFVWRFYASGNLLDCFGIWCCLIWISYCRHFLQLFWLLSSRLHVVAVFAAKRFVLAIIIHGCPTRLSVLFLFLCGEWWFCSWKIRCDAAPFYDFLLFFSIFFLCLCWCWRRCNNINCYSCYRLFFLSSSCTNRGPTLCFFRFIWYCIF